MNPRQRLAKQARRGEAADPRSVAPVGGAERASLQQLSVDQIKLPRRPARRFLGDVAALAESMQDYGLQQPIAVRAEGAGYVLTSGMRRLAAARMLGWTTITAFVRSISRDDAYLLDLIENLQRENLSPEEEADAFGELIRTRGWTLQQVADSVKRSMAYVSKRVRVFEDERLRAAITTRNLPISTAEELLAADTDRRQVLIDRALAERWDQVQARDALRSTSLNDGVLIQSPPGKRGGALMTQLSEPRPRGFTRTVREFHRLILDLRPEHLTSADRSALRVLFRDLALLARASTTPGERIFPALPATKQPSRTRRGRPQPAPSARKSGRR
jgi:ParB/RepB/Spo0J family partition protein